jgi:hypothetical protein
MPSKDGKIDAFFWTGGIPTASLLDLSAPWESGRKLLPNDDLLPGLQRLTGRRSTSGWWCRRVPILV